MIKSGKTWRDSISPKINEILSNINITTSDDEENASEQHSMSQNQSPDKPKREVSCTRWKDSVFVSDDTDPGDHAGDCSCDEDISTTIPSGGCCIPSSNKTHSMSSGRSQSSPNVSISVNNSLCQLALNNEVDRLESEIAGKNLSMMGLEATLKEKDEDIKHLRSSCAETTNDSVDRHHSASRLPYSPSTTNCVGVRSSFAVQQVRMAMSPEWNGENMKNTEVSNLDDQICKLEEELGLEKIVNESCNFGNASRGKSSKKKDARDSFNILQKRQDALIVKLSSELDCKLVELDQMRFAHEFEVEQIRDSFESDLFEKHEEVASSIKNDTSPNICSTVNKFEVKSLLSSLNTLKEECSDLKRSSNAAIQLANNALEQNYSKIIKYVQEEVGSAREQELMETHETLRRELEESRYENSSLKAELRRLLEGKKNQNNSNSNSKACLKTPQTREKRRNFLTNLSPLPTMESWAHFCTRFRQTLTGGGSSPKKLDSYGVLKADNLLKELCFAREGTPFGKNEHYYCEQDEDIFVDAISILVESTAKR